METKTKKIVVIGMLCAIAYVIVAVGRIKVISFLDYEAKDVIITIGGFMFGPLVSFVISIIVSFVEMFTISDTGIIGCIMNMIATWSFACVAAFIYKKKHTMKGAVLGLITGTLLLTAVMLLWNYLITPIYLGFPREDVVDMLLPVFLPFNLVKGGLNTAIVLLIYKPVVTALRKSGMIAPSVVSAQMTGSKKHSIGAYIIGLFMLITCILVVLVLKGIL